MLNHYLTEMSQIALSYGATIDKYVGDAIVIFFGDPETRGVKEDALACVEMAIAMRKRMRELQGVWRASGIEKPLQCRIGINTGYCTVGNFGSEDRMDYTIIGGGVNLASRLEAAATPGEILMSYETYANVRHRIHCEERGQISVKGIAYPVATYQVVDTYENLGAERRFIHEERPNLRIDLDLDAMSADDRGPRSTAPPHRGLRRPSSRVRQRRPARRRGSIGLVRRTAARRCRRPRQRREARLASGARQQAQVGDDGVSDRSRPRAAAHGGHGQRPFEQHMVDRDQRRPEPGRPGGDVALAVGGVAQSPAAASRSLKCGDQGVVLKSPATINGRSAWGDLGDLVQLTVAPAGVARSLGDGDEG